MLWLDSSSECLKNEFLLLDIYIWKSLYNHGVMMVGECFSFAEGNI